MLPPKEISAITIGKFKLTEVNADEEGIFTRIEYVIGKEKLEVTITFFSKNGNDISQYAENSINILNLHHPLGTWANVKLDQDTHRMICQGRKVSYSRPLANREGSQTAILNLSFIFPNIEPSVNAPPATNHPTLKDLAMKARSALLLGDHSPVKSYEARSEELES